MSRASSFHSYHDISSRGKVSWQAVAGGEQRSFTRRMHRRRPQQTPPPAAGDAHKPHTSRSPNPRLPPPSRSRCGKGGRVRYRSRLRSAIGRSIWRSRVSPTARVAPPSSSLRKGKPPSLTLEVTARKEDAPMWVRGRVHRAPPLREVGPPGARSGNARCLEPSLRRVEWTRSNS